MIFQHRHYVAIARTLAACQPDTTESIITQFAKMFVLDNPKFDWGRFVAAARGHPQTGKDR